MDLIVGKIGDSYKSALTSSKSCSHSKYEVLTSKVEKLFSFLFLSFPASVEEHVKLMVEVLPKWLQILTVKRGNFMKMDKNLELSAIINKLDHLIKESK